LQPFIEQARGAARPRAASHPCPHGTPGLCGRVPEGASIRRGGIGTRTDAQEELAPSARRQADGKVGALRLQQIGCDGKADDGGAQDAVESLVAERHARARDFGRQLRAARAASLATHLEHVAEIGAEVQADRHQGVTVAVIDQLDMLIEPLMAQEAGPLEVDDALGNRTAAQRRQRPVGQVGDEEHVVAADRGRQQRWGGASEREPQLREDTGVVVEQAVAVAEDIPIGVGNDEGVAILERVQALGRARPGLLHRAR